MVYFYLGYGRQTVGMWGTVPEFHFYEDMTNGRCEWTIPPIPGHTQLGLHTI